MVEVKQKTILLVDDDTVMAAVEKLQLEKEGYGVIHVLTGEKAIEMMESRGEEVDLILMDIDLGGGIDGTGAAEDILKKHDIPVVFLSSHAEKDIVQKVGNIKSYGYVLKNSGIMVIDASLKMALRLFEARKNERNRKHELYIKSLLLDQVMDLITITDLDGNIRYANRVVSETLGRSIDELARQSVKIYGENSGRGATQDEILARTLSNGSWRGEIVNYASDGTEVILDCRTRVIRDEAGNAVALGGISTDITERKETEVAVRDSEERFRFLSENIPACICSFLPDSTITYANTALSLMTGIKPDELAGTKFLDLLEPDIREFVRDRLESLTPENPAELHEQVHIAPDGGRRFFEWRNRAFFNSDGEVLRFLSVGTDITERWLSEQSIRKLLREKELIIKEVHHRIKNNMNVIFGLLTVQADMHDNNSVKDTLLEAAGRVQSMMMLYDRLYRSEIASEISAREYLPDLVNGIASIFPRRSSVRIETDIDDIILNSQVLSSLGIIISELVTNSMKYAFREVAYGLMRVSLKKMDDRVLLLYSDNGSGLPEDGNTENNSGFGLQLVNMLVKQIDGSLSIEKENGTLFSIEFTP